MQNSGQNCVGIERIYVYESLYDEFVGKAAVAVRSLRVGAPMEANGEWGSVDMGPITTAPQLPLIQQLVEDAVAKGAHLLAGGHILFGGVNAASASAAADVSLLSSPVGLRNRARARSPARTATHTSGKRVDGNGINADTAPSPLAQGLFYAPTLLSNVTHGMRIANEEVFGPVMTIFKVPNNSDDAVVAMANSTQYGLGATVFSGSPARANAIAARLHCGMVGVNSYGLNYLVQSLPFGGVRASGFDRFSGPEGLRACCLLKSVVTDWSSLVSIPTPVPKPLQYPVDKEAAAFTLNLIAFQFADTWWAKFKAVLGLAGLPVHVNLK